LAIILEKDMLSLVGGPQLEESSLGEAMIGSNALACSLDFASRLRGGNNIKT
jgi:hypothetical protein